MLCTPFQGQGKALMLLLEQDADVLQPDIKVLYSHRNDNALTPFFIKRI
jgi:hypothetical protein